MTRQRSGSLPSLTSPQRRWGHWSLKFSTNGQQVWRDFLFFGRVVSLLLLLLLMNESYVVYVVVEGHGVIIQHQRLASCQISPFARVSPSPASTHRPSSLSFNPPSGKAKRPKKLV